MKKQLSLIGMIGLTALSFSITSCKNGNEPNENPAIEGNTIHLYVEGVETRTTNGTLNSTTLPQNHTVGIFALVAGSTIDNGKNNKYTVGSDGNLSEETSATMTVKENTSVTINAYAPHNSAWEEHTTPQTFTVNADQSSDANYLASDLLHATATKTITTTDNSVGLSFAHKMARVKLTIVNTEKSEDLSKATVKINGVLTQTTFTPGDGTVGTATGTTSDITMATITGSETVFYAILPPQKVNAASTLFTIDTGTKTFTAKLAAEADFASGKSYAYTMNIKAQDVNLTLSASPSVTNWDENTEGESADAEETTKQ